MVAEAGDCSSGCYAELAKWTTSYSTQARRRSSRISSVEEGEDRLFRASEAERKRDAYPSSFISEGRTASIVGNVSIPLVGGVPVEELVAVPCGLAGSAWTGRAPALELSVWICSVEFLSELALEDGGCDTIYLLPFCGACAVDPVPFSFGFVASV